MTKRLHHLLRNCLGFHLSQQGPSDFLETSLINTTPRISHSKNHSPLLLPDPLPIKAQDNNKHRTRRRNACLRSERIDESTPLHPIDLNVHDHEAAQCSSHDNPRSHLTASFGVCIQEIGIEAGSGNHDTRHLHGRENADEHVVPLAFQGVAEDEDGDGHEG